VCGRNLITGLTSAASPRMNISSTCKVGQKHVVFLPLLTCSPSAWPSRLLYLGGLNSRRYLWTTLFLNVNKDSMELFINVNLQFGIRTVLHNIYNSYYNQQFSFYFGTFPGIIKFCQ
jgi:hypothetical protein